MLRHRNNFQCPAKSSHQVCAVFPIIYHHQLHYLLFLFRSYQCYLKNLQSLFFHLQFDIASFLKLDRRCRLCKYFLLKFRCQFFHHNPKLFCKCTLCPATQMQQLLLQLSGSLQVPILFQHFYQRLFCLFYFPQHTGL